MATSSISGANIASAAGIESLISQYMALERTPIAKLQTQRDELDVRRAVYSDIDTKLSDLRTAIAALYAEDDTADTIFKQLSASSSDADVLSASASSSAAQGTYSLTVDALAQSHAISSSQQAASDQALWVSGTFVIGGAQARSVSNESVVADTVDDFGTGAVRDGQTEMGSGTYYVETRYNGSWQFRVVDAEGSAVSVARAGSATAMTTNWQDLDRVDGTTFNTGRGLSIDFGSGDYTSGLRGSGAASVDYTAQGASIQVSSTSTLNDIRDKINAATYADGNEVTATVVNRTLVIKAANSGANTYVEMSDVTGTPLSSLGLLNRAATDGQNLADDEGVTAFGTGDLVTFTAGDLVGQSALDAGQYYVEIGSGANAGKFRLVDGDGDAVAIASSSGGATSTTDWIAISDGAYDTGRGLTITFQGNGTYDPVTRTNGAARVSYDNVNAISSPLDAQFTVNGLSVSRSSNTGLDDVVDGVTFNLSSVGSSEVNVAYDASQIVTKVKTLVTKMNDLIKYIRAKTEPSVSSEQTDSEQTIYTRGTLGGDWGLRTLRRNLVSDLLGEYSDAADDAPSHIYDVGITLNTTGDELAFSLSDQNALESALETDYQSVADLFGYFMDKLEDRVSPYLDGEYAILASTQSSLDTQIEQIEDRIENAEDRLKLKEQALRTQYEGLASQLTDWTNQYSLMQSYNTLLSSLNRSSVNNQA
jgi:flagellar hook-associated protein 2